MDWYKLDPKVIKEIKTNYNRACATRRTLNPLDIVFSGFTCYILKFFSELHVLGSPHIREVFDISEIDAIALDGLIYEALKNFQIDLNSGINLKLPEGRNTVVSISRALLIFWNAFYPEGPENFPSWEFFPLFMN